MKDLTIGDLADIERGIAWLRSLTEKAFVEAEIFGEEYERGELKGRSQTLADLLDKLFDRSTSVHLGG